MTLEDFIKKAEKKAKLSKDKEKEIERRVIIRYLLRKYDYID